MQLILCCVFVNLKRTGQDQLRQECVELRARNSREYVLVTETVVMFVKARDFLQETVRAFAEDAFAPGLVKYTIIAKLLAAH